MRALIIDRDRLATQTMTKQLQERGHSAEVEQVKNAALESLKQGPVDAVFFDPSPLTDARPFVLGIRRVMPAGVYPYILLCSHNADKETASKAGANDFINKPLNNDELKAKIENADRFSALTEYMRDLREDYPSENGVIAKSAFNQLYLSCVDRADRYGEQTYLLFFTADNYSEIAQAEGQEAADQAFKKMAEYIARLRRQSDILGQTGRNEYCLMLQRPVYESEPVDAANRFHDTLSMFEDMQSPSGTKVRIRLKLVALPTGAKPTEHLFTAGEKR